MLDKETVTVSVITFNSSRYVIETLESIKAQTYPNIILQISDDCSTDNTVKVCKDWIEKNGSRFVKTKIVVPEHNTGVAGNLNRAWDACETKYIKDIAGDDKLMPNCIEDNMQYMKEHPEAVFVFSKIKVFGSSDQQNKKIEALEKRIKKKANKRLFGTTGVSIPTLASARDELYYELKNIWYGKAV